ncbi:MAG: mono/diheme cytochrome c family protein [Verrucomicrobiales bacterium]|jgi:mono/diheme cytochrome c family protein
MTRFLQQALATLAMLGLAHAKPSEGEKLFALKVKPLFAEKCMACHGDDPEKLKGDFDMRTREAILAGGETFGKEVLVPGKGDKSYLYITTTRSEEDYEMPPKQADQLTVEQTWWIRDWINAGAPWLDDKQVASIQGEYAEGEQVPVSKALNEDWQNRRYEPEKLWAYRPLEMKAVPDGDNAVDHFIDARLAEKGLKSAPPADARELLRRLRFGLTGLPPSRGEVAQFESAYQKDAKAAVRQIASQLMATPHYGEHFARHWLDVTRYADSAGFANDYARPNAWRYRDYVVRAFNNDKPYKDFVREQIAGDEIDPTDPEHLVATGFLRMGPWEQTAMSVFKETRQLWLDDVTDSVGQTFLAHAMQCAKCHDHKFDPIPTRDYYSMMAVFSTTQFAERNAPFLQSEPRGGFEASEAWVKSKIDGYSRQRNELNAGVKKRRKADKGDAKVGDNGLDPGDEASLARMGKNIERHKIEYDRSKPIALSVYTGKTVQRNNIKGAIALPAKPWGKGFIENDTILTDGDAYSPGAPVKPGALSAAESLGEMELREFPAGMGKRRSALAGWIIDEKNPLTARVMVNRVWSWHFGRGLAGNPNNFGGTGALPTHPKLLDHLAAWFMDNGWSVQKLNQLIVTSDTYQRTSRHPDAKRESEIDPKHQLYASFIPRRLTAEELRDAMLVASGEMNFAIGGIPARPDLNPEVATQPRQIMGGTASVYEPDPLPGQRNRRSLYTEKNRGLRDPFLEAFNQPGPDDSCELRETSTVAPQALTLFNAEEVHDRALAFAARLIRETNTDDTAVQRAFELALGRPATPGELTTCLEHWKQATNEEAALKPEPKTYSTRIQRTVMAEKTGEPYTFWEEMPTYKFYVPDLQRSDANARTRALAHVCLVLFNTNEFAYVD